MDTEAKTLVWGKDIRPSTGKFRVRGIFNPGGARLKNGDIMLYARVAETPKHGERHFIAPKFVGTKSLKWNFEKTARHKTKLCPDCFIIDEDLVRLPTISHLRKILVDKDGFTVKKLSQKPDFYGLLNDGDFGVEDPRITHMKGENRYLMTYVSISTDTGISTSLASSRDMNAWKRHGVIFRQQNKDVVILPEKVNGYYVAYHRPEGTMMFDKPSIWISYSKDLVFWGRDKPLLKPRSFAWDGRRIGSGTVPIKTDEGWLTLYHGVKFEGPQTPEQKKIYSAGALLFSLKDPGKLIGRTSVRHALFGPELDSEKKGFLDKVVFPTTAIEAKDGKHLLVYSGGADSNITVRRLRINEILD